MQNLVFGILYGIIGQVGSFVQLQAALKYGWYPKYTVPLLLMAVPLSWFYVKSVEYFINAFDGSIWESRLLGFSIGIIMFTVLSAIMFKEPFTLKTIVCLLLGFSIVAIQVLWRQILLALFIRLNLGYEDSYYRRLDTYLYKS